MRIGCGRGWSRRMAVTVVALVLVAACGGATDGDAGDGSGGGAGDAPSVRDGAGGAGDTAAADTPGPGPDGGAGADSGGLPTDSAAPDGGGGPTDTGLLRDTGGPRPPCEPCGTGDVRGRVCAPNEQVWVSGAAIWVDTVGCDGQPVRLTARSDANGYYLLEDVPCGDQTLHVTRGSYAMEFTIPITPGVLNDITGQDYKFCFGSHSARLAVITGDWDNIEYLIDELGLEADVFELYGGGYEEGDWYSGEAVDLLSDLSHLQQYDILFIDCGAEHDSLLEGTPIVDQNIKQFVEAGGSLYMSDFAYIYGERVWPNAIDYYGDNETASWNSGGSGGPIVLNSDSLTGLIQDQDLKAYLGNPESIPIELGLSPLVSAVGGPDTTTMHVIANIPQFDQNQPLILSYRPTDTSGHVIYTTFHNTEQHMDDMQKVLQYLVFML